MSRPNPNIDRLFTDLRERMGISRVVFCPGARAMALLEGARRAEFEILSFFDERSAGFFALAQWETTCVVTTSGTAVGELLPAMMEAFHRKLGLVVVTADRPERARGRGTPQATDQRRAYGVFARYVEWSGELGRLQQGGSRHAPLQINVCLEDPVRPTVPENRTPEISEPRKPLVLVGELAAAERARVRDWLLEARAPCYLEPLSGLREDPALAAFSLPVLRPTTEVIDHVFRWGGVPVHSFYRDLESKYAHLPVTILSSGEWPGLERDVAFGDLAKIPNVSPKFSGDHLRDFVELARKKAHSLEALLAEFPRSEPALLRSASECLAEGSGVYLGNSMPIREWDLAASRQPRGFVYSANRGLNGIDGQVSSFLGWQTLGPKVAFLGDLTTLHDLNGLWSARYSKNATLVVLQNGGGRIFDFGLERRSGSLDSNMINEHSIHFEAAAKLYGIDYVRTSKLRASDLSKGPCRLIELECDLDSTRAFWKAFREL